MDAEEIARLIGELENRVERLRALYDQYFMGIERIEPLTLRKDVDRRLWALRREQIRNTGLRFKLETTIQRYNTYQQYWQRIVREIEAGTYQRDFGRAALRFGDNVVTAFARRRQKMFEKGLGKRAEREGRRPTDETLTEDSDEAPPPPSGDSYEITFDDAEPAPARADELATAAPLELEIGEHRAAPPAPTTAATKLAPSPAPISAGGKPAAPPAYPTGTVATPPKPPPVAPAAPLATKTAVAQPTVLVPSATASAPRAAPTRVLTTPAKPFTSETKTAPETAKVAAPPVARAPSPPFARAPSPPTASDAKAAAPLPRTQAATAAAPPGVAAKPAIERTATAERPAATGARQPAVASEESTLSPIRMRQIYGAFVEAKRRAHESTASVTYEKIASNLESVARELRAKHKARSVDFEVVMKNGKPVLKPVVKG